jgi:hypothetical protein
LIGVVPAIAYADTDTTEAELGALRRELRELAARDRQEIEALHREVRELSAKLARRPVEPPREAAAIAPPGPPPSPAVPEGLVVTQSPGNLPGRSSVPPYTGIGSGDPGASPVTPASPVSSGGNKVVLSISGQVNRALLWGNDGHDSKLHQVDNNNSSTRFRIVGEAKPMYDTVVGMDLETEIRPNSSATQTLTQNQPQSASA